MPETYAHLERRIASEQQTFARPLRSLVTRDAVLCDETRTIAEAARLMREQGVGSVVVVNGGGQPVGVLTSSDLVSAIAEGAERGPLIDYMTRDPFALPAHALAYEAALAMLARRIRHVLVIDEGRVLGVVSERDLFSLQRLGLGEISMEIRLAQDVAVVAGIASEVRKLSLRLIEQGVAAEQLTSLVSVLNDRLTQRVIELVREGRDLERISWCWLAFGSEGRLEQTFTSDQDNGLMFMAHDGAPSDGVRERLLPFARAVNEALDRCGFALCKGNVMASNPSLCLSLDEWRAKMGGWIEVSNPQALLEAVICFDFRAIYGDVTLADRLRAWVHELTQRHPVFLRHMASNALKAQPAIGRLGGFVTDDVPGAKGTIDLKQHGTRIFIDAARVYALARAVPQTNTADRLRTACAALGMKPADIEAMVEAFFVVQAVRLRNQAQAQALGQDEALHNRVDPTKLGRIESAMLKESMRIGRELQERLTLDYQL